VTKQRGLAAAQWASDESDGGSKHVKND
jgi:hypothetical protein